MSLSLETEQSVTASTNQVRWKRCYVTLDYLNATHFYLSLLKPRPHAMQKVQAPHGLGGSS